jgi:hypothetical protein
MAGSAGARFVLPMLDIAPEFDSIELSITVSKGG